MKRPESARNNRPERSEKLRCALLCVAFLLLMLLIFIVSIIPTRYDIRLGQVPNVTIAATK